MNVPECHGMGVYVLMGLLLYIIYPCTYRESSLEGNEQRDLYCVDDLI